MSEFGSKRLVAMAIRYAIEKCRESVTLVHKGNIMKYTEGAFRDWGYEVAREQFPDDTTTEAELAKGGPAARADAESDAKDLFARGRDLRTKGDCAAAVPLLRKAYKIHPSGLGSLRNVAECEEQLGHHASARRAWLDIKRALVTLPPDAKYDGWDREAETAAARLQPKIATVIVDVAVQSPTGEAPANDKSGVELFVNGAPAAFNREGDYIVYTP
jgi:hypothetical protein